MNVTDFFHSRRAGFDAVFFDIDGTLITAQQELPGAANFLQYLRCENIPFYLLTNDGNHSTLEKSQLMAKAGVNVSTDEIISCGDALVDVVRENHFSGHKFFVMGDLGVPCYAENAGLFPIRDVKRIEECTGVIVGEGFYNWQKNISAVFNFFRRHPERPFIVPNPDSYWPGGPNGDFGIGAGAKARFVKMLLQDMDINLEILYLGKPYPAIYRYAMHCLAERLNSPVDPKRILMLGDSLQSDILGANRLGISSGLLLTGITSRELAEKAVAEQSELAPEIIFETIGRR